MDLRTSGRFPLEAPIICEFAGRVIKMEALNISRTGLLVTGPELLPVGSVANWRFSVGEADEIEVKGLVRHKVHGCGVQFVEPPPDQQAKLSAYLDRLAAAVAGPFTPNRNNAC